MKNVYASLCQHFFGILSCNSSVKKYMVSHGRNPLGFIAYISKATINWSVQHLFSHCRCNKASFGCKNNFLTRECSRSSKKVCGSIMYVIKGHLALKGHLAFPLFKLNKARSHQVSDNLDYELIISPRSYRLK